MTGAHDLSSKEPKQFPAPPSTAHRVCLSAPCTSVVLLAGCLTVAEIPISRDLHSNWGCSFTNGLLSFLRDSKSTTYWQASDWPLLTAGMLKALLGDWREDLFLSVSTVNSFLSGLGEMVYTNWDSCTQTHMQPGYLGLWQVLILTCWPWGNQSQGSPGGISGEVGSTLADST